MHTVRHGLILLCCSVCLVFSIEFQANTVDSLHEYQMNMNINQFSWHCQNQSENWIKLQDVLLTSVSPAAPLCNTVYHPFKKI